MLEASWIDIGDSLYDGFPALRCSAFKAFCRSAAHYQAYLNAAKSDSPIFRWGRIVHSALLQPLDFAARFVIAPDCDKRTKLGKETYAEFQSTLSDESIIISDGEFRQLLAMRDSYNQFAGYQLINPVFERPGCANLFGVDCKIKPDILSFDPIHNIYVLSDLKTTEDASEVAFTRSIFNYGYHIQAAFYALVTEEIIGFPIDIFTFYALEKEAPFAMRKYVLSKSTMDFAKQIVCRKLALFQSCLTMDLWEGYSKTAVNVELPRWLVDYDL